PATHHRDHAFMMERELFGEEAAERGGRPRLRRGRIEIADGGTLFIEAIENVSPPVQLRLLRLLQERVFERVGDGRALQADVRLVVATSADLDARVRAGEFREDLKQRLATVRIELPPLRERLEDLPLLVQAAVREFNREHGRRVPGLTRGAIEGLARYPWPGNVRELRGVLEGLVVSAKGRRALDVTDLPAGVRESAPSELAGRVEVEIGATLEEGERRMIEAALRRVGFDKRRAAAMLAISLRTLYRKIERYRLG
ncbi:MAG: sigma-54-dependent Fis family transcriptional regulator, partial [Candidatus Eisenbacteria bacterium]|nr:sigma-54-dependent Fis family transcriptional regulator [Candidatus Eisenbacteria bacterium]